MGNVVGTLAGTSVGMAGMQLVGSKVYILVRSLVLENIHHIVVRKVLGKGCTLARMVRKMGHKMVRMKVHTEEHMVHKMERMVRMKVHTEERMVHKMVHMERNILLYYILLRRSMGRRSNQTSIGHSLLS